MVTIIVALLAVLGLSGLPEGLTSCGGGRVTMITSGDQLTLEDGTKVRLAHILAPRVAAPKSPHEDWPHAKVAKAALERLALERTVSLHCESNRPDRHGALVAHVVQDGEWLQARLVAEGAAFAYARPGEKISVPALIDMANTARDAKAGLWSLRAYAPTSAENAGSVTGRFALVEGTVLKAAKAGDRLYLNFGEDYRRDFTVEIPKRLAERMAAIGNDPLALTGRKVRVTGFVDWKGGPHIALTHPDQLETLPPE
ncbi:thermonuclease family protein [Gimibacter soli]|uniref:Thermonuclease family protein n=1 Tax=Gimibacter soli TaxID=3024400 RepID=A0AAE9XQP9_9PROT|nr:thermonuclease family protein [Gimibacter soli]WCL54472.1 thermonuclease family protein [Gimibacter soli]